MGAPEYVTITLSPADTGNVPVVCPVMYDVPDVRENAITLTVPP